MDTVSPLKELIGALEYGNRFHISIEFFSTGSEKYAQSATGTHDSLHVLL